MLYDDCRVYGPYKIKNGKAVGRNIVIIYFPDGSCTTKSHARFLVEKKLNRHLLSNETVDHIDRDSSNDSLYNLRVLNSSEHRKIDAMRVKDQEVECVWCHKKFIILGKSINNRARNNKAGPFCSKSCVGKYSRQLQLKRCVKLVAYIPPNRKYYTLKDAEVSE